MSGPFVPRLGGVLSADIAVPEHEREVRFYSRVLGTGERPLWQDGSLLNDRGIPIIGLGARTAAHERLPVQWMPHIQVADVGASARRAVELGGTELMHSRDAEGRSQWAVLQDPNGAAFGVIPIVPAEAVAPAAAAAAVDPEQPMGRIAWLDLTVPDADRTRDFYREVVGWGVQDVAMKDGDESYADYAMLGGDGDGVAGVCHARGRNAAVPPVWMLYLPVGDLAESLRRAEADGGRIRWTMNGKDGKPAYAMIEDPVGAAFALAQA